MVDSKKQLGLICACAVWLSSAVELAAAKLSWLEQIQVETFAELREVERFQLKAPMPNSCGATAKSGSAECTRPSGMVFGR